MAEVGRIAIQGGPRVQAGPRADAGQFGARTARALFDQAAARERAERALAEVGFVEARAVARAGEIAAGGAARAGQVAAGTAAEAGRIAAEGRAAAGQTESRLFGRAQEIGAAARARADRIVVEGVQGAGAVRADARRRSGRVLAGAMDEMAGGMLAAGERAGRLFGQVADALIGLENRRIEGQREQQLADATFAAGEALRREVERAAQDPEWQTTPERYGLIFDEIAAATAEQLEPELRGAFVDRFRVKAADGLATVRKDSLAREVQAARADLDRQLPALQARAAGAASPVERAALVDDANKLIEGFVRVGYLTAEQGAERQGSFIAGLDEAAALRLMTADPEAAQAELLQYPERFGALKPAQHARLLDQANRRSEAAVRARNDAAARADRLAEKRLDEAGDAAYKDLLARAADGSLDRGAIEAAREVLAPAEYKSALAALAQQDAPAPVRDDPATFRSLYQLLETDPGEARRQAYDAHGRGLIANSTLQAIAGWARGEEGRADPQERQLVALVKGIVGGGPAATPDQASRAFVAQDAFVQWLNANPDAGYEAKRAEAFATAERYSLSDILLVPPMPRSGRIEGSDPATQRASLQAALERFAATRDAMEENIRRDELRLLRQWQDLIDRQEALARAAADRRR